MSRRVRFGPFELDRQTGELWKHGLRVRLQGKPFQILTALLERPGEAVSREELQQRLWTGDSFVDFDSGLNTAANRLRIALGDSVEHPRYVETLSRSGYRFVAEVEEVTEPEPIIAPAEPSPAKPGWLLPAILAVAILAAAAAIWIARRPAPLPAKFQQLTFRRGFLGGARFAPDGQTIVYSAKWAGQPWKIFLTSAMSPETRTLGYDGFVLNAVSPSGELLLRGSSELTGTNTAATLSRVPMNEGAPLNIANQVVCSDWSVDGTQIAAVRFTGTESRIEFPIGRVLYKTANRVRCLRLSRDGTQIVFTEHHLGSDEGGDIRVVDMSGRVRTLASGWATLGGLGWSASGNEVWFAGAQTGVTRALWAVTLTGTLRLVARVPASLALEDIARDGRVLITRQDRRVEMAIHIDGAPADRDVSWFDRSEVRAFSADGRLVLFDEMGDAGGKNGAVYLHRVSEGATLRLGEGHGLALAPDGRSAITLNPADRRHINIVPVGGGSSRQISGDGPEYRWVRYFPDGTRLLVGGNMLYVQSLMGGKPEPLKPELQLSYVEISADGKYIAGTKASGRLAIANVESGERREVQTPMPVSPVAWFRDGRSLLVRDIAKVPAHTFKIDLETGRMEHWKDIGPADLSAVLSIDGIFFSADLTSYVYSFSPELGQLYLVEGWK
jgi:DNA-binding winged helix-turn-helix (wHTH) protein